MTVTSESTDLGMATDWDPFTSVETRIFQGAEGVEATIVNGVITRCHDEDIGARPGRLVRGSAA